MRGKFITNTASQPAVYLAKEAEAVAVLADPETPESATPHITLEAARTEQSRGSLAAVIVAQADAWRQISAQIEDIRLAAKDAVRAASTVAGKRAAAIVDWSAL